MMVAVLLFIVGLLLLIKGGDWFVDGSVGIAHRFHVPELLIGATIVSIGTTLPEVMVSATSALSGHGEMAYGNAVGSIICNTALIAALSITIRPALVKRKTLLVPVLFFFSAAAFYMGTAYTTGKFSRITGFILLAIFLIYIIYTAWQAKKDATAEIDNPGENENGTDKTSPIWKDLLQLVVGAAAIALGAKLLVDNGTTIAQKLGVPEAVIALTFVALGTSLPELVTSVTALAKGHGALSLGNIIGANLFNLVLVAGISAALSPFGIPQNNTLAGINTTLIVDLPVMLGVMLILTLPALLREKLSRVQGIVLLGIYAGFCAFQFVM